MAKTYFQKKCDLPDKSKLHTVQLHTGRALKDIRKKIRYVPSAAELVNFHNNFASKYQQIACNSISGITLIVYSVIAIVSSK